MVQYVITPWRNRQELLEVRRQLYPERDTHSNQQTTPPSINESYRRRAVSKISVWMQRGNCPHLVESTAIITAAVLNDIPNNSSYCVRAAYSAAFSRFVTGLLDSHQDKRRKLSMYSIAKTLGVPATYVELRHQATHEELPSLSKLRIAARKALGWIWDYYWTHLSAEIQGKENDCKYYVRGFLEEESNEMKRQESLARLREYADEEVLNALMEVGGTLQDTRRLLESARLFRTILDVGDSMSKEDTEESSSLEKSLEEIKAELLEMDQDLAETEKQPSHSTQPITTESVVGDQENGWSLWEGPWIPKPIGTI